MNSDGNLSIQDLTIGVDDRGMTQFVDDTVKLIFADTINLVNEGVEPLETEISKGWQGGSKNQFVNLFNKRRESMVEQLESLQEDFRNALFRIGNGFKSIDNNMMASMWEEE